MLKITINAEAVELWEIASDPRCERRFLLNYPPHFRYSKAEWDAARQLVDAGLANWIPDDSTFAPGIELIEAQFAYGPVSRAVRGS